MSGSGKAETSQRKLNLALQLREEIVEAALWRNEQRLGSLLPSLVRAQFSAEVLSHSGLPFLLQDSTVWPAHLAGEVASLLRRWRESHKELRLENPELANLSAAARRKLELQRAFRGKLCSVVVVLVDKLEQELQAVDGSESAVRMHRALAARLVARGFDRLAMLDGLTESEVADLGNSPWDRALLSRAKVAVSHRAQLQRLV